MAIDPQVPALALAFKEYANELTKESAILQLDDTWPSACTLDLFTQHLWEKQEYSEQDTAYLDGVAAYLAGLCFAAWSHFPDKLEINILYNSEEYGPGVSITAEGGKFLDHKEKTSINISQSLKFILADPPEPFPIYYKFTKSIQGQQNFIALFALGLFSGQSPFSKGPWKEVEPTKFKPYLDKLEEFLSSSSARYYARVFPDEPLGQIAELYLHNLILPHYEIVEKYPAELGTKTLLKKLHNSKEKPKALKALTINLAQMPCPFISAVGFTASCGLLGEKVPESLSAICVTKRDYIHDYKPAVMIARSMLGKDSNWIKLANEEMFDKAKLLLLEDCEFGLSPLIKFFSLDFTNKKHLEIYQLLSWSYIDVANEWFESNDEIEDSAVLLLKAYLAICLDNYQSAEHTINYIEKKGEEVFKNDLLFLKAVFYTFTGKFEKAISLLEDLLKQDINIIQKNDATSYLLTNYIRTNKVAEAVDIISSLKKDKNSNINFLFSQLLVARLTKRDDLSEKLLEKLKILAPLDRRIFSLFYTISQK